ncbi:MAG: hypothetical protein JWP35_2142 [Caulobacter sp.]|nr:hypothetical protein [Caulobacter sp.]
MDDEEIGGQVKEVFAYYGRAFYCASVLETGLTMALLWADFLAQTKHEFEISGRKAFKRENYEAVFDAFMADQHRQVMGSLIKRVNSSTALSESLKSKIAEANRRRNFLTHHYFRERAVEFARPSGREKMIVELNAEADFFEDVDRHLDAEMIAVRRGVGVDEVALAKYVNEFLQKVDTQP